MLLLNRSLEQSAGPRVLLVENDWDTVEALGDMVPSSPNVGELHWAGSVVDALDLVSRMAIDTVVVDMRPPAGEKGRETVAQGLRFIRHLARRRHRPIDIIVLYNDADRFHVDECAAAGAATFVNRTAEPTRLARHVWQAVREAKGKRASRW